MDIKTVGLSTSAFGYSMGNTGKKTERKNPKPWILEEFISLAAVNGVGGIEAPLMRFVPGLESDRLKQIQSQLAENKMFFVMDAELSLDVGEISTLIPFAKAFGSPIIRIKTSNILSCSRKRLGKPWREHVEHCIQVLSELAPKLRESGLRVAIENHQDLDSNDLLEIIEKVGSDVVGVNFDIGNAFSTCEDPMVFATKLGRAIINIHLKDYKIYKSDEGFRLVRCPLGEGAVDFKTILPFLAKEAPNAKMVIELGALEARNIAHSEPGFWEEIQPRTTSEKEIFYQSLESHMIQASDEAWRTPWEKGASSSDIVAYEAAQIEISLSYLRTILHESSS